MTPQLLIASAELLYMDVPAAFRRALGHGVGFRSLDEEERFAALLNAAVQPATPSRWRNQRAAPSTPQKDSIMDEETRNKYGHHKPKTPEDAEKIAASRRIFAEAAEKLRELLPPPGEGGVRRPHAPRDGELLGERGDRALVGVRGTVRGVDAAMTENGSEQRPTT